MRIASRGKSSPYEVRCPRCDVSFPVETRTCIHCGGPTGEAGGYLVIDDPADLIAAAETGVTTHPATHPIEAGGDPAYVPIGSGEYDHGGRGDEVGYDGEHGPPSFVQSLLRSMGSFIWIIILIAFSLSRSCENG